MTIPQAASAVGLSPGLFDFLRELRENNNRDWFQANRARYEANVQEPLLAFVEGFAPRLQAISTEFVADPRPSGGSLFRIYRDTRFSKDKTPYKTNVGLQFRYSAGKDVHAPGFYLHIEPGQAFAASGIWHPDAAALRRIRDAIVAQPDHWQATLADPQFAATCSLWGQALKRPPQGYDPAHPLVEDLKRTDFVASAEFSEEDACSQDFRGRFAHFCQTTGPFVRFLTEALGLRW